MDTAIYQRELSNYTALQRTLHHLLEQVVALKPVRAFGYEFVPTRPSIREQIRNWPLGLVPFSPALWVEPRKGVLDRDGVSWQFDFHGQGVSFKSLLDGQEIDIEYTFNGELGLTEWTTLLFLETSTSFGSDKENLSQKNEALFGQMIAQGYLSSRPSRVLGDEPTFVPAQPTPSALSALHAPP